MYKYKISSVSDYIINTDNVHLDHQDVEFDVIKNDLNSAKSLLDKISNYDIISQKLDVYKTMRQLISYKYRMQTVTNATLKIYEIISQMNLIKTNKITAFCNAELPGNFIIGINHYIKTMYKNGIFRWVASSYLSNVGTLGDYYGIFEFNRNNWLMDTQMNGDLTDKDNILELTNRVLNRFPNGVDLYTSDAGFDVSSNYNEQEEQTLLLNYGQILSGIFTLMPGGSLVTKQFTYFTPFNKSLITLLSILFDELYITKPVTSRPLNSEIYLVGINFKGINDELKNYLINRMPYINHDIPLILYDPNKDILNSAKELYYKQIEYLHYSFSIYENKTLINTEDYKKLQDQWIIDNPIYLIDKKNYISYNKKR